MTDELKTLSPRLVTVSLTVVKYAQSVIVTDEVIKGIEDAAILPLHNPAP